jgi:hypothetical protein
MKTAILLLAALPMLAAGTDHSSLRGRIMDANGTQQISGAIVTVTAPSGYIVSAVTTKSGQFRFASLPEGEYNFRVTARGYAIYERDVTVSAEGGVREIDIRLVVPADRQTVSVLELMRPVSESFPAGAPSSRRGD